MTGINLLEYEELLKKTEHEFYNFSSYSKEFNLLLNEVANCYDGKTLSEILLLVDEQKCNLSLIVGVFEKYVKYLQTVRMLYVWQDSMFSKEINNVSNNLREKVNINDLSGN